MKNLNCVIVDDEPISIDGLLRYMDKIPYLTSVGTFESALDLLQKFDDLDVDLIFLDIQMPYLNGVEFAKTLNGSCDIIFTTAYADYALEGFDLQVLDYLLKPISFERFLRACERTKDKTVAQIDDWIFVNTDSSRRKISFHEIQFIEGCQNYIKIHTKGKTYISHSTLKAFKDKLPREKFFQVHKSFIANLDKTEALVANQIILENGKRITVSRSFREELNNRISS